MNIDELNRKIEASALAQRPLWFTLLCGFVGGLALLAGLFILGLFCFNNALITQHMSIPTVIYSVGICALYVVGARRLWLYHWSAIAIWGGALAVNAAFEFGSSVFLNSGTINFKHFVIPVIMLGLAIFKCKRR